MAVNTLDKQDTLHRVVDNFMSNLRESVEFESGSLFVFERSENKLREIAKTGDGIDFITAIDFPLGAGLSAWVAQKCKVIYLADIHRGSRHGLNPVRCYLSMPLEINNRVIGVLNLGHTVANAFDDDTMATIEEMCKDVTRKIYNHTYLNLFSDDQDDFTN